MADKKISQLPAVVTPAGTDEFAVNQSGTTKKVTLDQVHEGIGGDVVGPSSAVDDNIATFDGTTGKLIQDSGIPISDVVANTAKVTNATHTGDATGATALTLATVNSDVGSFTNADITVNAKGLVTAAANGTGGASVFGTEFEIFQSLAQSNTSSSSVDKVDATTATKPAGTYRVGFYCDITNSDGTDIWEVQFLVNGTPIHQHSNGGDLYQNKPDGNNDWSSESSVHYITLGSPATIDLNIKFGTNDNQARAANATIEIWRVS